MNGVLKNISKKLMILSLTCVMAVTSMGSTSIPTKDKSNVHNDYNPSQVGIDEQVPRINNLTGISNADLSSEYVLHADTEYEPSVSYKNNDIINVIVRLKDESLLSKATYDAKMAVKEYALTDEGINYDNYLSVRRNNFISSQESLFLSTGYSYSTIFNGFSGKIYYKNLAKLEKRPEVESVMISERYNKPEAITTNEVNVYSTGIYDSSNLSYDGTGTVVGILDTGLDYTHTAFQKQPVGDDVALTLDDVDSVFDKLTAKKLDAENEKNVQVLRSQDLYRSKKVPFTYDYADSDADVYPINDHGTHVAGIIAGQDDVITGVATNAQLAIFKVFGNEDKGAPQEALLAALNDAVLLGVDAINMSLGSSCGFSRAEDIDETNDLYDSIKQTGICLLVAASNSYSSAQSSTNGDTNLTSNPDSATIGSPSTYDAAMSVASISGIKTKYLLADGNKEIYFKEGAKTNGKNKDFVKELLNGKTEGTYEYVVVPGIGQESNYTNIDVKGKIAVVRRGAISFEDKIKIAQRKGALAVLIYNNVSGIINMSIGKAEIPACSIEMDYGEYLVAKEKGTLQVSNKYLAGPFMSPFSSWGPKSELELSPDITAHGGEILSAVRGGYDTFSGTSMACPNMAGATILVRQYVKEKFPELSSYEVTELTYQLMMSTATIANNELGNPYSPRKQGAGLADIAHALETPAYLYVKGQNKTKLSLGDDVEKTGVYDLTFNLKNNSNHAVSYKVNPVVMTETVSSDGKTVAEKAYMFKDFKYTVTTKNAIFNNGNVTVKGYEDAQINIEIKLSNEDKKYLDDNFANGMFVEGYIELKAMDQNAIDLNIPYLAFYGDWTKAPLLDVTAFEVGAQQEDSSILEEDKLKPDVYATSPMGGFRYNVNGDDFDESYYYLGAFGYYVADGYEKPATIEDKASMSNNVNATYSLYCIAAGLLRNAKYCEMKIVDDLTGEVVFNKTSVNNRKSSSNGGQQIGGYVDVGFYVDEHHLENNRKYTYSMECFLDYDKHEQHNLKNKFSFSFYVDNESPTMITSDTRIKENRNSSGKITSKSLNMYVYDNHYIQGYFISTFSGMTPDGKLKDLKPLIDGCIPVTEGKRNDVNSISLDITNMYNDIMEKGGKVAVQFYDYAKNTSLYTIDLNNLAKEVTDIQVKTGKHQEYSIKKNKQVDLNGFIEVYPKNTEVEAMVWTSDNEEVAIVKDGLVTGLSEGVANIKVENQQGTCELSFKITVLKNAGSNDIKLSSLDLKTEGILLERGEKYELYVEMQPYNLTEDIELEWKSTSSYISFVVDPQDQRKVTITALKPGTARLTVSAKGKTISATCRITIKEEYEMEGRLLKSYTGRGDENGVVEIPDDIGVVYVNQYAFINNPYIKKIIFPEGTETIGEASVYGCENLEEVVFPSSLKTISKFGVAWNPNLKKVVNVGKASLSELAFYNCPKLEEIDLSQLMFIGDNAFFNAMALKKIDISNAVYVGDYAFGRCTSLSEIITSKDTNIGNYSFIFCTGLVDIELNSSKIGSLAFSNCSNLARVTFNNPVDYIGYGAFYNCKILADIVFKDTVRVIEEVAFANCSGLTTINLPAGLEKLGTRAFGACSSLHTVNISKDAILSEIGNAPFYGTQKLKVFTLEDGAKYLSQEKGILYDKAKRVVKLAPGGYVDDVFLPDSVVEVGEYAFSGLNLVKSIGLNQVEIIGKGAFYNCMCNNIYIGKNTKYIYDEAFYGSYVTELNLPEGLLYIGNEAFTNCKKLKFENDTFVLPQTVEFIGEKAFAYTEGFTKIVINSTIDAISPYMFYNCINVTDIDFGGVTKIGNYAFYNCKGLTSVVIPDTVVEMGEGAFRKCESLSHVKIPANLEVIPLYCFEACTSLETVDMSDSVKIIGAYSFAGTPIEVFDFKNVEKVAIYAFEKSGITAVNANNLTQIGSAAFSTTPVKEVNLPNVTEIYNHAFYGCSYLEKINLPKIVSIDKYAFYNTDVKELVSDTIVSIGSYAFMNCDNFNKIVAPNLEKLGSQAFTNTIVTEFTITAKMKPNSPDLEIFDGFNPLALSNMPELTNINVENGNEYFVSENGVLYKKIVIDDGRVIFDYFELVCYPTKYRAEKYTMENNEEGERYTINNKTIKIGKYAFYKAQYLTEVIMPETLRSIGASAFEDCKSLKTIHFLSAEAPVLEGFYDARKNINYINFVTPFDGRTSCGITMYIPKNGVGYNSYIWKNYFTNTIVTENDAPMTNTIYLIKLINSLPQTITIEDKESIELARQMYNSFNKKQQGFISNIDKLAEAEDQLSKLEEELPKPQPEPEIPEKPEDNSSEDSTSQDSESTNESTKENKGCSGHINYTLIPMLVLAAGTIIALKLGRKVK